MVYYGVNQAINGKKSIIKIQNYMFTKCDINNTYKSSGIHVHTSGTVSPIQAAIRTFQILPLKMNNKFQGFHPTCIQFGQASMKWKNLIFKINTNDYFSYSNSKWAVHKSSKCKLKMLCYTKQKNINLIFGHCCCFSHPIHLVSTIIEMQQHLNKVNNRIHVKITSTLK